MSESESEPENVTSHAASLQRLKSKDPEFFEFLKQNDNELLDFHESESELESNVEKEEEDDEEEVTLRLNSAAKVEKFKLEIKSTPSIRLCKELIASFKKALQQADGFSDKPADMSNSDMFNNVIKLCLIELVPALYRVLKLKPDKHNKKVIDPSVSKKWKKVHMSIKSHLIDMMKMLALFKESQILKLLLKHVSRLIPFYLKFVKLARHLLKKIVAFWCTAEKDASALASYIIVTMTKSLPKEYFGHTLKQMYLSYVRNTKFTSPSTWPRISFMRLSLIQIYSIDPEVAYEHAFVYIRQLSIHLRNAVTTKKKEAIQTVYNWQYVHCIYLWSDLLCALYKHDPIKSLVYPLVQVTIGAINLIPTAKYVPLRFHLVQCLLTISKETETFIPILPFLLEVLTMTDYNKKASSFSVKSFDLSGSLKATKSQLLEGGFRDGCIAELCKLILSFCEIYSHSIGFPELVLPATLQIKTFIKQCKNSKYNQQLKTVLQKIEENSKYMTGKRRTVTFKITDDSEIKKWEDSVKEQGNPIMHSGAKTETENGEMPPKKKQKVKR